MDTLFLFSLINVSFPPCTLWPREREQNKHLLGKKKNVTGEILIDGKRKWKSHFIHPSLLLREEGDKESVNWLGMYVLVFPTQSRIREEEL